MVNLEKGLVGHWTMDDADTSGGTLYDRSAYDNHGTLQNTITTGDSGIIGEAYTFNEDGNINISHQDYLNTPEGFSVSIWVKSDGTSSSDSFPTVISKGGNNEWQFHSDDTDMTGVTFNLSVGGSLSQIADGGGLTIGEWAHVVLSHTGTDGQQSIYVNGELTSSNSYSGTPDTTTSDLNIALNEIGASLDDAKIYNRALSASEVSALYNMRSQRTIKSSPRVYYYDTQSLYNSNGHANNKSELDTFFDPTRSDVSVLYNGIHKRDTIYHGLGGQSSTFGTVNAEPEYFTNNDGYSWEIEGTFVAPESGTYSFGIDGDDAMDLIIDGTVVAEWYGGHGFNGDVANHSGTISLDKNTGYDFTYRYEEGGGGSGGAVGWKKPSDNSWKIFPANLLV